MRLTGGRIVDQKVLFLGAGEAATGIAELIVTAMQRQGLSQDEARQRCWLVDSQGLVVASRSGLAEQKQPYAHQHEPVTGFGAAVDALRPTAIIGVAAVGGTFTEPVLRSMAKFNPRPIIFALSNPTSKSECTAQEAYRWTDGRALFASGSPFDPVDYEGRSLVSRQGNNSYIFPGVGLGAIASSARHVTGEMFLAAAETLAAMVSDADLAQGSLYPPLVSVREVSARIGAAVAAVAYKQGLARVAEPADLLAYVRSRMYEPHYRDFA